MMAQKEKLVFLGFEDEEVGAECTTSKVNKIGGLPDWPENSIEITPCAICGMKRPLLLQLYAPLEQSHYHRTFFIFACLQANCSQNARSWTCLRVQHLETKPNSQAPRNKQKPPSTGAKIKWCNNLDDWGTQDSCDEPLTEENGNTNSIIAAIRMHDDESDDEDYDGNVHMMSAAQTLVNGLSQLNLKQSKELNANCAAGLAKENIEHTFAEIESEETDLVLAEAPIKPRANLRELLQTTAHSNFTETIKDLTLKSFYIAVDIEQPLEVMEGDLSVEHIQEIYEKYKIQTEDGGGECLGAAGGGGGGGGSPESGEAYEAALPLHGDVMFHNFLSTIKMNPTQILRYTRDAALLLIEPLVEFDHFKCQHCKGPTICEVQILSTLIPKLSFQATGHVVPIDFGNVLIFTCLRSCWDTKDKVRYENVIVQNEK